MKYVAPLRYGVIFKKAFSKPEIFTAFVKAVFGIDIEIDKVETEKSFKPAIGKVDCRYDLYAEDTKNRLIIDIQHDRSSDHYHRFLYYHMMAIAEQVSRAENYRPARTVLTIVVLTGYDKHQVPVATLDMDPKTPSGKPLQEIPHQLVYLAPRYFADDTQEPMREWLRAIHDTLDEQVDETTYHNPLIKHIFDEIEQDDISPTERAKMFEENTQEELRQVQYQLGVMSEKVQMARALLAKGMDVAFIQEVTDLPATEIVALGEQANTV